MATADLRTRALAALAEFRHRQELCEIFVEMLARDLGIERYDWPFPNRPMAVVQPGIHLCLIGDKLPNLAMRAPTLALYKPCTVCGEPVGFWPLPPYDIYPPLVSLGLALDVLEAGQELVWLEATHKQEEHGDTSATAAQ